MGRLLDLNEANTRAKLIDPAIHKLGVTEDLISSSYLMWVLGAV